MATALDVISRSLRLIGVVDAGEAVGGNEAEDAVQSFNDMMSRWEANGIDLGFTTLVSSASTVTVPDSALNPIIYNLALDIAPEYSRAPSPEVVSAAQKYYSQLQASVLKFGGTANAGAIINRAIRLAGASKQDMILPENGIEALNALATRWEANGIDLNWTTVTAVADVLGASASDLECLAYNLACDLAREYNLPITDDISARALILYRTLLREAGNEITLASGTTAQQVILKALRLSGAFTGDSPLAYYVAPALQTLNEMVARWQADGVTITYTRLTNPATTLTCTDAQLEALANNLAVRIAAEYGQQPPAEIQALAVRGYDQVLRFSLVAAGTATASDLVRAAFRLVGPDVSYFVADGIETLNQMLRAMQADAPQLWRQTQAVLFLTPGTESYALGTGGDRACRLTDFVSTTLTAAASAGASTITVTSITGLASGDQIGVELADGTRQWTTINGAPSGSTVTLTATLTGAAASGATVYSYTTILERPLRITDAQRRVDGVDIEIELSARSEYFQQPNKTQRGPVLMAYYSPELTNGRIYVWPTGSSVKETLRFTFERAITTVSAGTTAFDWPEEWNEAIKYQLAYRLADEYRKPERVAQLKAQADEMWRSVLAFDQEYASIYFSPDLRQRMR